MEFVLAYHHFKADLAGRTGQGHALLAIQVGLAIYLLCLIGMDTRRGTRSAIGIVAIAALFDSVMTVLYPGGGEGIEPVRDSLWLLMWPTLFALVSRFRRWRWTVRHHPRVTPGKRRRPILVTIMAPTSTTPVKPSGRPYLRVFPGYGPGRQQG